MPTVRRTVLTMAAYLVGLVMLFGAAIVFLTGNAEQHPRPAEPQQVVSEAAP